MIKFNGKDIVPHFNGKAVSRVMYNGKQIYPNQESITASVEVLTPEIVYGEDVTFRITINNISSSDILNYTLEVWGSNGESRKYMDTFDTSINPRNITFSTTHIGATTQIYCRITINGNNIPIV